jgi:hypothetical protein
MYPRVLRLVLQLALAVCIYAALRRTALYEFTARERDGLGTVVLLIGNIYAVMFAFVIFVIWGQFTDVENFVMRECNALNEVLRFSEHMGPDTANTLRRAVEDYARRVPKSEWAALAAGRRDRQTEKAFSELMAAAIDTPVGPGGEAAHQRLIDIVRKAGEHRDERITKSLTRIPDTLVRLVKTMAAMLLALVFVYPFQHWLAGVGCFAALGLVLFLADLVMTDTDNPFQGICNVSAKPFVDLLN